MSTRNEARRKIEIAISALCHRFCTKPTERFKLTNFAKEHGIGGPRISKEFKERFGDPPLLYISIERLGIAIAEILNNPDLSLEEASTRAGFRARQHMAIISSHVLGMNLLELKRAIKNGEI
jgi:methylphosphotriester-DNA--protein-cysteine methyltransferase